MVPIKAHLNDITTHGIVKILWLHLLLPTLLINLVLWKKENKVENNQTENKQTKKSLISQNKCMFAKCLPLEIPGDLNTCIQTMHKLMDKHFISFDLISCWKGIWKEMLKISPSQIWQIYLTLMLSKMVDLRGLFSVSSLSLLAAFLTNVWQITIGWFWIWFDGESHVREWELDH